MNRLRVAVLVSLVIVFAGGVIVLGVSAQAISVDGEFTGELVGYGEATDPAERSHVIHVDGQLSVEGEAAQDVTITIEPGPSTVIDSQSVRTFTEGDREVAFDQEVGPEEVRLTTDEIPGEDTTILIEHEVIFVGGTTDSEINAGTVSVEYQSPGGTEGGTTFEIPTDVSESADNRIETFETEQQISLLWQIAGWIGIGGILLLAVAFGVRILRPTKDPPGKTPPGP